MKNSDLNLKRFLLSKDTPWGKAEEINEIADGIVSYSTASHGGYFLATSRNSKVPLCLKKSTFGQLGLDGWYEEDCDWAIVVFTFPQYFEHAHLKTAMETLKRHHSDAWRRLQNSSKL